MNMQEIVQLNIMREEVLNDIRGIINDYTLTDNNQRADYISKLMKYYDYYEVGCGTNRIVFSHPDYEEYVFKIALDDRGIKDNNLEFELGKIIPEQYITKCYYNNSLISVSEKIDVMDKETMKKFKPEVMEILRSLSREFILNDVGHKQFLNWGVRDGKPVILDYAYLRRITPDMEFICGYNGCEGKLAYTKNFSKFVCVECGCKRSFSEIEDGISALIEEGMSIN